KHARSFVCKVRKELLNENNGRHKIEKSTQVNTLLTHSEYLSSSEDCMAWHNGRKLWEINARHLAKVLQVSEETAIYKQCFVFLKVRKVASDTLRTLYAPNSCQGIGNGVHPHIDKSDGRLKDNLWELIIPRQNTGLCFVSFPSTSKRPYLII
ncbi:unnamed protein product, partial [Hymenolepis diminuta]